MACSSARPAAAEEWHHCAPLVQHSRERRGWVTKAAAKLGYSDRSLLRAKPSRADGGASNSCVIAEIEKVRRWHFLVIMACVMSLHVSSRQANLIRSKAFRRDNVLSLLLPDIQPVFLRRLTIRFFFSPFPYFECQNWLCTFRLLCRSKCNSEANYTKWCLLHLRCASLSSHT